MKKLRLLVGAMFCLASIWIVTLHVNLASDYTIDNQMVVSNMEALTQGEVGEVFCYGSGDVDCNGGKYRSKYE